MLLNFACIKCNIITINEFVSLKETYKITMHTYLVKLSDKYWIFVHKSQTNTNLAIGESKGGKGSAHNDRTKYSWYMQLILFPCFIATSIAWYADVLCMQHFPQYNRRFSAMNFIISKFVQAFYPHQNMLLCYFEVAA